MTVQTVTPAFPPPLSDASPLTFSDPASLLNPTNPLSPLNPSTNPAAHIPPGSIQVGAAASDDGSLSARAGDGLDVMA